MILTRSQGERLAELIKLMRPDWDDRGIVKTLQDANRTEGLPAHDFDHAIRAAAAYATETAPGGGYAKRTPTFLAQPGKHWDTTAPARSTHTRANVPPCEDHAGQDAHTCRSCRADIMLGDRPEHMMGKRLSGPPTPPPPNYKQAAQT